MIIKEGLPVISKDGKIKGIVYEYIKNNDNHYVVVWSNDFKKYYRTQYSFQNFIDMYKIWRKNEI